LLNYSFDINQSNSSTCFQRLRTFISKILHSGRAYPQSQAAVISGLENKIFQLQTKLESFENHNPKEQKTNKTIEQAK
jgi:hypothetical protein